MDVKIPFLNGKLKEEVYVKWPPGFESSEFSDYVCILNKAIYGLKQAPKACSMCKVSVKSKGITSNRCEKNTQVPESVGNKMHKAFPLPVIEFPLPVKKVPPAEEKRCHY
uniref:Retrovirus-related Pol polyprotein from transposon TNT 1-94 n=1 Tax=Tanacetum cinerariifolium TaxID=118510 RepID=A0A699IPE4_TANCI|nr:retrovirus-related Pol polyprotein from transposon TNT 1-94 [Tanacetum cinerariifolium]